MTWPMIGREQRAVKAEELHLSNWRIMQLLGMRLLAEENRSWTQRGWRRNQRNLTAENTKGAEVENILFVFSAFLCGINLRGLSKLLHSRTDGR